MLFTVYRHPGLTGVAHTALRILLLAVAMLAAAAAIIIAYAMLTMPRKAVRQ
jgi:hypothetical protein